MKRTRIIAEEEFPDKRSSSKSANLTVEVNINLCDECRKIDLEGALNFPAANIKDAKGIWVADIRPKHVTKHASTCSLCHVWSGILSENDSYRNNSLIPTTLGLRAFSIMRNLEEIDQWRVPVAIRSQLDNSILGLDLIKQNSYLVRTSTNPTVSSHWFCAREVSPQVDYKLLLDWLEFCSKHHSKSCNADRLHRLESFMAIDCDSGKVVSPPSSCTYAALSYVWGAKSSTEQVDHDTTICTTETNQSYLTLDERAPRIVQDAIIVTKELGLKYLWIDKYCIN
ncbi:hypothetical protein BKA61DRAFT_624033 [Leptodontidium sp. MPI-SDFR-AT-0119]|nr:hypothetical protein BKA61DRAFT_624033 [Leptodontidium sp. MPI-SDFR-AT-0119]